MTDGRDSVMLVYNLKAFSAFDRERLKVCAEAAMRAFVSNIAEHEYLAISGAMRWPLSFRPEALVQTRVEII